MRPDNTPEIYDYYTFKRYRNEGDKHYYQYRITTPLRQNNIISSNADEEIANKLIRNGAQCIEVFTFNRKNNKRVDVAIYRIEKWRNMTE